jgi:hypothetical protein
MLLMPLICSGHVDTLIPARSLTLRRWIADPTVHHLVDALHTSHAQASLTYCIQHHLLISFSLAKHLLLQSMRSVREVSRLSDSVE